MPAPFDPDGPARGSGLFGLPSAPEEAAVHVLPVPFDATTSYRRGTAGGPAAVLAASRQVDLEDLWTGRPYEAGIALLEGAPRIGELQRAASDAAERARALPEGSPERAEATRAVDACGAELNALVRGAVERALAHAKLPCVLGGDHSAPFGALEACSAAHAGLGVLHFDAHADLRRAYEGFEWSHASILYNVVERLDVARVLQVGVRDLCGEELERIERSDGRIRSVFDREWASARFAGADLRALVRGKLDLLPESVYVSFDVDGLDPTLCPSTGTPVPGGLDWHEAMLWLEELAASGRRVVGLDLCEVCPGPGGDPRGEGWDAIVGARLLYRLIGFALRTRG